MRGVNNLKLNQRTINEALQEYLNKRTTGIKIDVTMVTEETGGIFTVTCKENEDIIPFETERKS